MTPLPVSFRCRLARLQIAASRQLLFLSSTSHHNLGICVPKRIRYSCTMASEPRDAQTCILPDGRTIGFAEYGEPTGHPVLYFHGFPASRLEASMTDRHARRHNVRILALDRPGYGLSTRVPERTTIGYPDDVLAFAAAQNLPRFGILGTSGGGPYALACASKIPVSRLTHVGILAGAGPWNPEVWKFIPKKSRIVRFFTLYWPWGLRMLIAGAASGLQWLARTRLVTRYVDQRLAKSVQERADAVAARKAERQAQKAAAEKPPAAPVDMEASMVGGDYEEVGAASVESLATVTTSPAKMATVPEDDVDDDDDDDDDPNAGLTIPERREMLYRALFTAFIQGPDHVIDDARLFINPPGYNPEDITYNPVMFWHGDNDANVPLAWAKPTIDRIPHSILKVYPGRTHFDVTAELDEIMSFYDPRMSPHADVEQ